MFGSWHHFSLPQKAAQNRRRIHRLLKAGVCSAALVCLLSPALTISANAQVSGGDLFGSQDAAPGAQMLLEADELIYDDPNNSVAAVGNVQIAYDNYSLVAERVTYNRSSGRVIATGGVQIVEPSGNRIFAEEIDITDDFQDGFVDALRVEASDNTRFAAESAERRDGRIAIFNNGVYTACEPCKKNPSKPPLWQIRADRVIVNNETKTVSYEGARFELFGQPIAYAHRFSHADPSVRRKSGFLLQFPYYTEELGFSAGASYFWALAPNYDLTLSGRYYSNQGFLGEVEWRHRTQLGEYNLRFAGIDQQDPDAFRIGTIDHDNDQRYAFMTSGKFDLNSRWQFGWRALAQSDSNFASTYDLEGYAKQDITNQVYLTGLNNKNYFDLRAQKFLIQNASKDQFSLRDPNLASPDLFPDTNDKLQERQAILLPTFDYNLVSDEPVGGGQVSLDVNLASIRREKSDITNFRNPDATSWTDTASLSTPSLAENERHHGIAGHHTRASAELEWKASSIVNGAMITTSLSARGDGIWKDTDRLNSEYNPLTDNDQIWRVMPAAMLEIRYPMVANDGLASHLFEPIAQIIVRPDETHIGKFPNEDAQSMVFDVTNLFERDKFSGFDRVEGGTRANIGFRYSASFENGASLNFVAGQSFHLGGKNSYAQRDLVNAGIESGLESDKSDYVAALNLDTGTGLNLGLSGRFDERSAELRAASASLSYTDRIFSGNLGYFFADAQPNYGLDEERHEIRGSGSVRLHENFSLFGNAAYDLQNEELFSYGLGVAYNDSCTTFSVAYSEADSRYSGKTIDRKITFNLSLRTIGQTQFTHDLNEELFEDGSFNF